MLGIFIFILKISIHNFLRVNIIQAIYVIRISRDGTIIEEFFEQRSNDPTFDQFVKKAVKDASPLPPIPPAIKGSSIEFGLRFRPGNIQ